MELHVAVEMYILLYDCTVVNNVLFLVISLIKNLNYRLSSTLLINFFKLQMNILFFYLLNFCMNQFLVGLIGCILKIFSPCVILLGMISSDVRHGSTCGLTMYLLMRGCTRDWVHL